MEIVSNKEEWKDITGFEGLYQVSNSGRIRRIKFINGKYNFIKTWESIHNVERELNISNSTICKVCNGKGKTAGGYIWKYKEAI